MISCQKLVFHTNPNTALTAAVETRHLSRCDAHRLKAGTKKYRRGFRTRRTSEYRRRSIPPGTQKIVAPIQPTKQNLRGCGGASFRYAIREILAHPVLNERRAIQSVRPKRICARAVLRHVPDPSIVSFLARVPDLQIHSIPSYRPRRPTNDPILQAPGNPV